MPGNTSDCIQGVISDYLTYLASKTKNSADAAVVVGYAQSTGNAGLAGFLVFSEPEITDRLGNTTSVAATTPFEIGSISKVFTTDIFQQAPGLGFNTQDAPPWYPKPNQPLSEYLPDFGLSPNVGIIDVKYLAAYASGLPQDNGNCAPPKCQNYDPGYPDYVDSYLPALIDYLSTYDPSNQPQQCTAWPPGSHFTYSNMGVSLLAMAALGAPNPTDTLGFAYRYNQAVWTYCEKTLGIIINQDNPTTANFNWYNSDGQPPMVLPIGLSDSYQWTFEDPVALTESGSGGIVSCGSDMLQFLTYCMRAEDNGGYPYFMQTPVLTDQPSYCDGSTWDTGFGWMFTQNFQIGVDDSNNPVTVPMVWKDGGVDGFTSWIGFLPKTSDTNSPVGMFVLVNTPDAWDLVNNWSGTLKQSVFQCIAPASAVSTDQTPTKVTQRTPSPRVHSRPRLG